MAESKQQKAPPALSSEEFLKASEEIRDLIKSILQEERQVMHMKTRPDIHKNILQHVKRLIQ